jgi:hypothetical protein
MVIVTFITIYTANCQVSKNNWLLGGNLSYSKSKSKGLDAVNSTIRTIDLMPNVGYFVLDKFVIGVKPAIQLRKELNPQLDGSITTNTTTSFGIGPFVRYYFLDKDNRINIFSDIGGNYNTVTHKSSIIDYKYISLDYSLFAGTAIFLNSSIGLEFMLGYVNSRDLEFDARGEIFQFRIGLQIHLEKQ